MTRIACLSDTHNQIHKVKIPPGDVLLHCGDLTNRGTIQEMATALYDLGKARREGKFRACLFICGNHDWLGEKDPSMVRKMASDNGLIWLQDSSAQVEELKFYGTAWTPEFGGWAFNLPRYDGSLAEKWEMIPEGTDVLLTHGPPRGILDLAYDRSTGCADLLPRVLKVKPKLHVFGHIHYSYGEKMFEGVHFVNAATCDERYMPVNAPIVVDL